MWLLNPVGLWHPFNLQIPDYKFVSRNLIRLTKG